MLSLLVVLVLFIIAAIMLVILIKLEDVYADFKWHKKCTKQAVFGKSNMKILLKHFYELDANWKIQSSINADIYCGMQKNDKYVSAHLNSTYINFNGQYMLLNNFWQYLHYIMWLKTIKKQIELDEIANRKNVKW